MAGRGYGVFGFRTCDCCSTGEGHATGIPAPSIHGSPITGTLKDQILDPDTEFLYHLVILFIYLFFFFDADTRIEFKNTAHSIEILIWLRN